MVQSLGIEPGPHWCTTPALSQEREGRVLKHWLELIGVYQMNLITMGQAGMVIPGTVTLPLPTQQ